MAEILINSYNRNAGDYQKFTVQLNTPLSTTKPTKLKLKYFNMVNGVYNVNGYDIINVYEVEIDNSNNNSQTQFYAVSVPAGSYTASDFASAIQTAIINASAANGYGWNYTVSYNSTTTQLTYNMTTTAPSGYTYKAAIGAITGKYAQYAQYITGLPVFDFGALNYMPTTSIPHLNSYNLLLTVNNNTHNHISTNVKKFTFVIPVSTSDNNITYTNNTNFDNSIIISPQSFNNITISMTCLEFDPVINNDCTMLLELEN